jgi:tetratricopeptide (TPR) repeat protein
MTPNLQEMLTSDTISCRRLPSWDLSELAAGHSEAAANLLQRAAHLRPHHRATLSNLARAYLRSGAHADAEAAAGRALALAPDDADTLATRALIRLAQDRPADALTDADAALAVDPAHLVATFARGTALATLHRLDEAEATLRAAIAADPAHAPSHLALGNTLASQDRLHDAEAQIRLAITIDPKLAEAEASLGFVLTERGRLAEAMAACDRAIALAPTMAQAHWNLGIACLLSGDWGRGWDKFEARKRHHRYAAHFPELPGPVWDGADPHGKTILVFAEQGLGDTIQFARYLTLLRAAGANPVLACDPALIPLLGVMQGVRAVPRDGALPRYDSWVNQMSLPGLLGTRPHRVPLSRGYLHADPARIASWRTRLPKRAVGFVWAGNPQHSNDRRRSLPPDAVRSLLSAAPPEWISLQVGPRHAEAALPDHSPLLTDYAETAAAIACLDTLVTVDTSVCHLAGALGVPCWVMLPHAPDWRWFPEAGERTPWYDSLRLFRQPSPGDWGSVIAALRRALG